MPNPKRKFSTTRRDKRRTHDALVLKPYTVDQESGKATLLHRVNLESGYYRGVKVMEGKMDRVRKSAQANTEGAEEGENTDTTPNTDGQS